MSPDANQIRQELQAVERYLARLVEQARRVEGERDRIVMRLADLEGCHDSRFAGPR
jgi:hypothetical protein